MTAPAQAACAYCGRRMWLQGLERCCDDASHEGRLVCADINGCVDVVLTRLHELGGPVSAPAAISVSGRPEPRPAPAPAGFRHDVRFYGAVDGGIAARCKPCTWAVWIDGGHDLADLIELVRQHSGLPPGARDEMNESSAHPAAAKLAEIQLVLDAFEWESGDGHYALEQIDDVLRGDTR